MLMPLVVALAIGVALLRGGSLANFGRLQLHWVGLVAAGLGLQLLIFTPFSAVPLVTAMTTQLYLLSMALLTVWVALNWRVPGMPLMALGLLMNFAAIAANGGYMPVSPASAAYAGTSERYATEGLPVANNSLATDGQVQLWLLTDILALPSEIPFANVFSIGDVLLMVGAGMLCYRTILRKD
jgi:hypothetical protein